MTVAVTGASGHIGANLVRALLDDGRKVRVLLRDDDRALQGLDVEVVRGDILDKGSLKKLLNNSTTLFHCAAKISLLRSQQNSVETTNVEGTRNIVDTCFEMNVPRLVHFSSIHAFQSDPLEEAINEDRALALSAKHYPYDRSKALSQRIVLDAAEKGLNAVVVNPTAVIGPHDYKISFMGATMLDICRGKMPALIDGGYNWVDARDIVQGALAAEEKGKAGECYLLGGHWKHIKEMAQEIGSCIQKKPPSLVLPAGLCTCASYVSLFWSTISRQEPRFTPYSIKTIQSHRHISYKKAEKELGYSPRPYTETIKDTIDWYSSMGMIGG